jgi:hypothetical protein
MSSLTSTTLQCPFKTAMQTMQNRVGPGVNSLQVRGVGCLVFKFMNLFDTALQVNVPTVYLTLFLKSVRHDYFFCKIVKINKF